ncbi:MAG: hypothetical protein JHC77_00170 [Opitutales bacterium]|jgi:hypothetical protein|nr:hypothetical protein [Opitutales bacterium]
MRFVHLIVLALVLIALAGCETTEKPIDSTLPQAQPASWQGGLPGMMGPTGGSGYR